MIDKTWTGEDLVIWDYAGITGACIDRPAKVIWPYLGEKQEAWADVHFTLIAGDWQQVGGMFTNETPEGRNFWEVIKARSERELVLKLTYRRNGERDDDRKLVGYDYVTLDEVDDHTKLTMYQMLAVPVPKSYLHIAAVKHAQFMERSFRKLKQIVEQTTRF